MRVSSLNGVRLFNLVQSMMAAHRSQMPSGTQDLYGGGCGCPHCNQALDIMKDMEAETPPAKPVSVKFELEEDYGQIVIFTPLPQRKPWVANVIIERVVGSSIKTPIYRCVIGQTESEWTNDLERLKIWLPKAKNRANQMFKLQKLIEKYNQPFNADDLQGMCDLYNALAKK